MYESMQNELANKKASAQMDAQAKIQNSDNMANAFLGVAGAVQQGIDIYAQSKVESEYSKVMTELEAGQMQYMNPDNENAVGDYTDFVTNTLDQHASNFGPILKSYFNKNRSTIINNAVSSFSSDYLKAVSKANAENFNTNYANAIRACASGQDYTTIEQKKIYRPVFDENGMRMTSEAINVEPIYETDTGDEKKDRFNGLRNYLYGIACLNNMSMDEAKAWVEDNTDKIEQDLVVQELPTTIEKLFLGQGVDANGEPIPSMSMDEVIDYLKSGFVMDGEMPYTGKKMTSDEALVYRNEIEKYGTQIAKEVQDSNALKIANGLDGWIKQMDDTKKPLTEKVLYEKLAKEHMIELNADGSVKSHNGLSDKVWAEVERIAKANQLVYDTQQWLDNHKSRQDVNGDGIADYRDLTDAQLEMIAVSTKGILYVNRAYESLSGNKWYADSTRQAIEGDLIDLTSAPDIIKDMMPSVIEYRAYSENGIAVPEDNAVSLKINEEMTKRFGEDWNNKSGDERLEVERALTEVEGDVLAEFDTALTNLKSPEYTNKYKQGLESLSGRLTARSAESVADLAGYIHDGENGYVGYVNQTAIVRRAPDLIGINGYLNDAEYDTLEISNNNQIEYYNELVSQHEKQTGTDMSDKKIKSEEGMSLRDKLESLYTEEQLSEWKKEAYEHAKGDTEEDKKEYADYTYYDALLINANTLLASKISAIETKPEYYDAGVKDTMNKFNLMASEEAVKNIKAKYEQWTEEIKTSSAYNSKLHIKSWSEIQSSADKIIEEAIEHSPKYGVEKTTTDIGDDPIGEYVNLVISGQSREYLDKVYRSASWVSEKTTDKILGMENKDILEYFISKPEVATMASDFAKQFKNTPTLVGMAWDSIFSAFNNRQEGDKDESVLAQAERDFIGNLGIQREGYEYASDTSTSRLRVELGSGNKLSDDTKLTIDKYAVAASNGEFVVSGIPAVVNSYYNRNEITRNRFEHELANLNGDELYNTATVCALEAMGMDISGLDPKANDFTDRLEEKFPEISASNDSFDIRMASFLMRVTGQIMYVSKIRSKEYADTFGYPTRMNIADNRFENSRMYKNDINNGPYMTYNSESDRNGVIAPRIVTETGDVIDLYPFTKEGQEQWQAQIVREMAHVLDDNTDLKKELQEPWQKAAAAHNNPILARYEKQYGIESSFMDTKPTYDKLLAMCPTYKRYLELCKDAGKYIDMEFPEFMPWGIGTSPRGEFYTRKQMNDNPIQEKMNIRNR